MAFAVVMHSKCDCCFLLLRLTNGGVNKAHPEKLEDDGCFRKITGNKGKFGYPREASPLSINKGGRKSFVSTFQNWSMRNLKPGVNLNVVYFTLQYCGTV